MSPVALRVRVLVVFIAMALASWLAHAFRPSVRIADTRPMGTLEEIVPSRFGDWHIDDSLPAILPSPEVQEKLDRIYNQVLSRTYVDAQGYRIMLSIAYGGDQSDGTTAHKPEVCYPAQGLEIIYNRVGTMNVDEQVLPVRRLRARMATRHEPITYWIVVGDKAVTSGSGMKMVQLRYGIRGFIPDGVLVRVSSIERDPEAAFARHEAFVRAMAASLSAPARQRLFGAVSEPAAEIKAPVL
ncbi:exosortase-associated protein EpsI, B-type [Azohydromonas caseinilytica]|uniref:EpsI family protein n=1 Tax=Azohydromonas caseinilytica TaxID=2728836 RepID=A0A848FFB1_9BURK|nr:exosortase-associated protein EpsI, B-type [Azohydromonas caseinilytica]NML17525.1 EpsI family protein [Azohydromonas caseinilytica]